jgi:hypothetical protein
MRSRRGGPIARSVTGVTMRRTGAQKCEIAADVMSAAIKIRRQCAMTLG